MSAQHIDLAKLNPEQLAVVKQQIDQELQHFTQSLQALNMARGKFKECIDDIVSVSKPENNSQSIFVPLSGSLYVKGRIKDNSKFMVDVGTGYYVDKSAEEAKAFYNAKIEKLNKESVQIQAIIKEKSQSSVAIENQLRLAAIKRHEEQAKQQQQSQ
ncbi:LAMI_0E16072g1_1 [Lachancea mirantina]|uniref:LAMI_0E16072g1_1 n=1 Tax=Lachancea mirantina TaxID=1230905 RepID=A0A1G4JT41_9SACH|nr:LAMI_0E16072g1_1 [Lachancea mirantina]